MANRCYFRDEDVAERYPFALPTSKVVVFAQSMFASRLFIMFFCGLGSWALSSAFLFFVQVPSDYKQQQALLTATKGVGGVGGGGGKGGKGGKGGGGDLEKAALVGGGASSAGEDNKNAAAAAAAREEAQTIRAVWVAVFLAALAMMVVASHLWYTAAYYDELAVNPRSPAESRAVSDDYQRPKQIDKSLNDQSIHPSIHPSIGPSFSSAALARSCGRWRRLGCGPCSWPATRSRSASVSSRSARGPSRTWALRTFNNFNDNTTTTTKGT